MSESSVSCTFSVRVLTFTMQVPFRCHLHERFRRDALGAGEHRRDDLRVLLGAEHRTSLDLGGELAEPGSPRRSSIRTR